MDVEIFDSKIALGRTAAERAAQTIRQAIADRGISYIIAATGASQFEFLDSLTQQDLDWGKTVFFHLDEYVGLPMTHAASFRRYLKERIVDRVHPAEFNYINGEAEDVLAECRRVGKLISQQPIDVAFVGIGENGHLAFNDPPADFQTEDPYIVVDLDEDCRNQQVGEGWFENLSEVPQQAISMSIRQIMKTRRVLCIVPDLRKAEAVRSTLQEGVSPMRPASILQEHADTTLYLDKDSSSLITRAKDTRRD